jgi:hypothetical protein
LAATARDRAAEIDRTAAIPSDLTRAARALCDTDPLGVTIVAEELAAASAALAVTAAGSDAAEQSMGLNGLRGAAVPVADQRSQLLLAAAALGIGRGALEVAVAELRRSTATPGADVEKPHWVVADAATELDAARLLAYQAARTMADADVAIARLMTSAAAHRVVDAALRVSGPDALKVGNVLERLSRDVRAVALILGTEEHQRATAADAMFPR